MRKASLAILAAALGFGALVLYLLSHAEPIEVIEGRLVRNGTVVSLEGKVRNSGEEPANVSIEVQWFDSRGRAIAAETLDLGMVDAQAVAQFSTRPRDAASADRYTIRVDRGKNPYGN